MLKYLYLLIVFFAFSCKQTSVVAVKSNQGVIAKNAMVVSAREEASAIGVEVMQKGGNAFDAMVATQLALAVSYPYAGNISGGGFMVYRLKNGEYGSLDFREKAPATSSETMYLDKNGKIIPGKSLDGALAVGVPGSIAGMWEAHQKFGKLPWRELVQPAIDLAHKGVVVTPKQEERINHYKEVFRKINPKTILLDADWKTGDTIKYNQLEKTLKIIQEKGKDGFYTGEVAHKIANFIQEQGGIITTEDLKNYQAKWRTPITFNFKDYKIISMPPPSSGGIVLGQIMKTLENYSLDNYAHNSEKYIQLLVEAERRAYADRSYFLGDPDFINIPTDSLLNKNYLNRRMNDFTFEQATPSASISYGTIPGYEGMETTHYSIVDPERNAVSVTTTLNGGYGSKLYDSELGFFYNNEMDDFSTKPGTPNLFGLIGGTANKIEPNKRMLSSMTPTIVEKNEKLSMVLGSPGGSTIITSVLQTILNHAIYGMGMQEAVSRPRFHHQWLPDQVLMEPNGFSESLITQLQRKNYTIIEKQSVVIGKVDAILVLSNETLEGGADPRGDDATKGF